MAVDIDALLSSHRRGWSLPGPLYWSKEAFDRDMERIFRREWLFACNVAEIANVGDYITMDIGPESVIVLRGDDDDVRAFHNVCRHRGSRLCLDAHGSGPRIVCPYHQWTYGLGGELVHAAHMQDGFRREDFALKRVHVALLEGMVYVSLADTPPDFSAFRADVGPMIAPHQPDRTKVAFRSRIVEEANWKLVIENNRECYHCASNHPELLASLVEFALPGDPEGGAEFERLMAEKTAIWEANGVAHKGVPRSSEYRAIRLPFDHGAISMTRDGSPACKVLLGDLEEPDLGSVRMFHVPINWNHFLSDHILHFRLLPISPTQSELVTTWLVHEDAVEGLDYSLEHLTAVWLATNHQDSVLAANNFLGTQSAAYEPGPYSQTEFLTSDFVDWYVERTRDSVPVLAAAE
ncbi:MAG: aromatic ring-hydroxylating dioxygenase subunit alpha [Devosia sp.]